MFKKGERRAMKVRRSKTLHHDHYNEFRALYEESGMTKDEVAGHLRVSLDTIKSWTKARGSASAFRVPAMAVEMLRAKIKERSS
jgi:DNA-binding XRE family transcriptional regulator